MALRFALIVSLLECGPAAYSQTVAHQETDGMSGRPLSYLLGPNDQISLAVDQLQEEFSEKTFRLDQSGDVTIPLIGRVHGGGLSVGELEDELTRRLGGILKAPDVVVTVTEFASQPVSVLGAVGAPGIRQLQGRKTLFEVLSLSGGLRADAGTTVKITRDMKWGPIPAPGATLGATGQFTVATVHVKDVMQAAPENIVVLPGDTVFVPKADLVYAVGSVTKPGGFPIGENETLSVLQVVSLSEGLVRTAASEKAKILRHEQGAPTRTEIPINLKQLMSGKAPDVVLRPDDILFVPNSGAKSVEYRTLEAIVSAASGAGVYARY
jgi:polysaccharide export outer membrane protein